MNSIVLYDKVEDKFVVATPVFVLSKQRDDDGWEYNQFELYGYKYEFNRTHSIAIKTTPLQLNGYLEILGEL